MGLLGSHQRTNAAVAVAVIEELVSQGWRINNEALRHGLANVRCPGRIEVVSSNPTVIIDAGHNPAAIRALVETLHNAFRPNTRRAVFGTSRDKDLDEMLRLLYSHFDEVLLTQAKDQPRAFATSELKAHAETLTGCSQESNTFSDTTAAWDAAKARSTPDDLICITGSFYIAGELRGRV